MPRHLAGIGTVLALFFSRGRPEARFQLLGPPEQGLGSVSLDQVRTWERENGIELSLIHIYAMSCLK